MVTTRSELSTGRRASRSARRRRRSSSAEGSDGHHQDRGRGRPSVTRLPPRTIHVDRATLVQYAGAIRDRNRIHWDERVRHAPSACPTSSPTACSPWAPPSPSSPTGSATPGGSWSTAPASPSRSSCPGEGGADVEVGGVVKAVDAETGRATVDADRDVQRRQGARPRRRRRAARLSGPRPCARSTASPLSTLTTMRVGGPAARLVTVETTDELVDAVREVDDADEPLLVVAGGSNLVVADEGFAGTVVRVATSGVTVESQDRLRRGHRPRRRGRGAGTTFVAPRGRRGLVRHRGAVRHPGLAPAPPRSRTSAPTARRSPQTIAQVRVWDRREQRVRTFANADCGFTYRHSRVQGASRPVRRARRRLPAAPRPTSRRRSRYADLARALGRRAGRRGCRSSDAREAVLALRRRRGMVLDADDHDTWSCGSFFTNPVLSPGASPRCGTGPGRLGAERRRRRGSPTPTAGVKTSAAWLIERAGFGKGYGLPGPGGPVDQAHPGPDQPRAAPAPPTCSPWPARSATACRTRSGSPWSTSRSWSAPRSEAPSRAGRTPRPDAATRQAPAGAASQASMSSSRVLRSAVRGPRPPHRPAGQGRPARRRRAPAPSRADSYCAASRDPNSSGSSAPRATWAPASTQRAQRDVGRARRRRPARRCCRGQTSSVTPRSHDLRPAPAGPRPPRTPWPRRSGRRCVEGRPRRASAPSSSPPCGTQARPARRAMREGVGEVARCARAARRCSARTRPPCPAPRRRSGRRAGPACARPAGAASGWPRRRRRRRPRSPPRRPGPRPARSPAPA